MATTIAHPRSIPSGPSGKTVAGFLVGVLVALGVGYGITNVTDTVDAAPSSALGADRVLVQRGADLAAQQAAALAETQRMIAANENWSSFQSPMDTADLVIVQKAAEYAAALGETQRMIAANENWSSFQSPMDAADLVIVQKAADYAALQARVAAGERMRAVNEIGFGNAAGSSAADFGLDGASHALPEYIRSEIWSVPVTSSPADFGLDGASHALPEYIRAELATQAQNSQLDSQIEFLTEQWKARQLEPKTPGPVE